MNFKKALMPSFRDYHNRQVIWKRSGGTFQQLTCACLSTRHNCITAARAHSAHLWCRHVLVGLYVCKVSKNWLNIHSFVGVSNMSLGHSLSSSRIFEFSHCTRLSSDFCAWLICNFNVFWRHTMRDSCFNSYLVNACIDDLFLVISYGFILPRPVLQLSWKFHRSL